MTRTVSANEKDREEANSSYLDEGTCLNTKAHQVKDTTSVKDKDTDEKNSLLKAVYLPHTPQRVFPLNLLRGKVPYTQVKPKPVKLRL